MTNLILCPACGHYTSCKPSTGGWICCPCGAYLEMADSGTSMTALPFTDTSEPDDEALLDIVTGTSEWLWSSANRYELTERR